MYILLTNNFSGMMTQLKPRILVITKAIMVHPNPIMDWPVITALSHRPEGNVKKITKSNLI